MGRDGGDAPPGRLRRMQIYPRGAATWGRQRSQVNGRVNGRLTEAPAGATRRLNGGAAAGRAAAEVGACALPDAPPSRRGLVAAFDSDDCIARGEPSA